VDVPFEKYKNQSGMLILESIMICLISEYYFFQSANCQAQFMYVLGAAQINFQSIRSEHIFNASCQVPLISKEKIVDQIEYIPINASKTNH
jgi:hypothetical protein